MSNSKGAILFKDAKSMVKHDAFYMGKANDESFALAASGINKEARLSQIRTKAITSPRAFQAEKTQLYENAKRVIKEFSNAMYLELTDPGPVYDATTGATNGANGFGISKADEEFLRKIIGVYSNMLNAVVTKAIEHNYPTDLSKAAVGAAQLKNVANVD